jgi:hypothetical protein
VNAEAEQEAAEVIAAELSAAAISLSHELGRWACSSGRTRRS